MRFIFLLTGQEITGRILRDNGIGDVQVNGAQVSSPTMKIPRTKLS